MSVDDLFGFVWKTDTHVKFVDATRRQEGETCLNRNWTFQVFRDSNFRSVESLQVQLIVLRFPLGRRVRSCFI